MSQHVPFEDLLEHIDSKYRLVIVAAKRAKQLNRGAAPLIQPRSVKPTYQALEEIASGKLGYEVEPLAGEMARELVEAEGKPTWFRSLSAEEVVPEEAVVEAEEVGRGGGGGGGGAGGGRAGRGSGDQRVGGREHRRAGRHRRDRARRGRGVILAPAPAPSVCAGYPATRGESWSRPRGPSPPRQCPPTDAASVDGNATRAGGTHTPGWNSRLRNAP